MIIRGQDVIFTVDDGAGNQVPICCARTAALATVADIGETSTSGTGQWKTYKGLKLSFSVSMAGLVSFDMNYSIAALRQRQVALLPISFAFIGTDQTGRQEKYTGSFIITNISTPSTYNGLLEYSVEGQGTGALTITQAATSQSTAYWGWKSTPFDQAELETFAYQKNGTFTYGQPIPADYALAPDRYYLVVKYPHNQPLKKNWLNTAFNFGNIEDQVFSRTYTAGGFYFAYTRLPVNLDSTNKTITYS